MRKFAVCGVAAFGAFCFAIVISNPLKHDDLVEIVGFLVGTFTAISSYRWWGR